MTRRELKKIKDIDREIRMWKRKLFELESASEVGSPDLNANGRASTPSSPVETKAIRRAEIGLIVKELEQQAECEKVKILRHILTIEDPLLRQVVNYRIVEGMSWKRVAYHTGQTEDSARMMFNRAYPI